MESYRVSIQSGSFDLSLVLLLPHTLESDVRTHEHNQPPYVCVYARDSHLYLLFGSVTGRVGLVLGGKAAIGHRVRAQYCVETLEK